MKKWAQLLTFLMLFLIKPVWAEQVLWTANFSHIEPNREGISALYCKQHSPTQYRATLDQVANKEMIRTKNGLFLQYSSYHSLQKNGIFMKYSEGQLSGRETNGQPWSTKIVVMGLSLEQNAPTYVVWSTPDCKGTMLGVPKIIKV